MAIVKCPNGHRFDTDIYGNTCPLCNIVVGQGGTQGGNSTHLNKPTPSSSNMESGGKSESPHTRIGGFAGNSDPRGHTVINPHLGEAGNAQKSTSNTVGTVPPARNNSGNGMRTTIRRPNAQGQMTEGRKLVGFLVCYNRFPNGKAFNIYEGRNYVGRDTSCDISIPDDNQMSGRHMSILYRSVDMKFKFRDEQSSNGTFVNKNLLDDGELENYDIIRVGGTLFIFIAIPQ